MGNLSAELPKGVYADAWALPGNEFFLSILQLLYLSAQRETKQNMREYIHVSRVIVQLKTPNQYICRVQLLCIISLGRKKVFAQAAIGSRESLRSTDSLMNNIEIIEQFIKKAFQSGKWDFIEM